ISITWERSNKFDIGVEFGVMKGFIDFEIDYFHDKRSNMLVPPTVITPVEYGIGLSQENAGKMENRGIEIMARINKRINKDFDFSLNGNITFVKNKLIEVFETAATYDNPNRRRTGRALGTQFGLNSIGYFLPDDFDNEG